MIKNDLEYDAQDGEFVWLMEEDPYIVARNLYANFRKAEKESFSKIIVLVSDEYKNDRSLFWYFK